MMGYYIFGIVGAGLLCMLLGYVLIWNSTEPRRDNREALRTWKAVRREMRRARK